MRFSDNNLKSSYNSGVAVLEQEKPTGSIDSVVGNSPRAEITDKEIYKWLDDSVDPQQYKDTPGE